MVGYPGGNFRYYEEKEGDVASFPASGADLDHFVEAVIATADHVAATRHSSKKICLSVDEWNVWYESRKESAVPTGDDWPVGPRLLEDQYNVADAVVNRTHGTTIDVEIDLGAFDNVHVRNVIVLTDDDPYRRNSAEEPDAVVPRHGLAKEEGSLVHLTLPPVSWTVVELGQEQ
ncbi:alpha-L-arabinofuranosidase C-terminal domain-containing protein [Sinomonas terricola]|uniref:alpha-L-arabinofuranosidase C-terminal domain-containing protein n=1 Tax=Sinomonas terricola TaxID=3110330 RepID=UPI003D16BE64